MDTTIHQTVQTLLVFMVLAALMLWAYTGKSPLKEIRLVEPIVLILLWLAGQR